MRYKFIKILLWNWLIPVVQYIYILSNEWDSLSNTYSRSGLGCFWQCSGDDHRLNSFLYSSLLDDAEQGYGANTGPCQAATLVRSGAHDASRVPVGHAECYIIWYVFHWHYLSSQYHMYLKYWKCQHMVRMQCAITWVHITDHMDAYIVHTTMKHAWHRAWKCALRTVHQYYDVWLSMQTADITWSALNRNGLVCIDALCKIWFSMSSILWSGSATLVGRYR